MEHVIQFLNNVVISPLDEANPVDPSGSITFLTALFGGLISFASFIVGAALGFGIFKIGFQIHTAAVNDDSDAQKRGWKNLIFCIIGFIICMVAFGMATAIASGVPMLGFNDVSG